MLALKKILCQYFPCQTLFSGEACCGWLTFMFMAKHDQELLLPLCLSWDISYRMEKGAEGELLMEYVNKERGQGFYHTSRPKWNQKTENCVSSLYVDTISTIQLSKPTKWPWGLPPNSPHLKRKPFNLWGLATLCVSFALWLQVQAFIIVNPEVGAWMIGVKMYDQCSIALRVSHHGRRWFSSVWYISFVTMYMPSLGHLFWSSPKHPYKRGKNLWSRCSTFSH